MKFSCSYNSFRRVLSLLGLITFIEANAITLPLTWQWSNPSPHGNNIIDMADKGNVLTIQVSERGQIHVSEDLVSWLPADSHTTKALRAVTFFGSHPIIVGESGTVLYGDTATDFRPITLGTEDWFEGIAASTNLVVAVGDNGAIYTSADGLTWRRRPQAFTTWLRSAAYGAGTFVTVGEGGFIATSKDGVTWQKRSTSTTADLNRVAWVGDRFWAVGDAGATLTSIAGVTWQLVNSGATNALFAATEGASARLIAGDAELHSLDGSVWSNQLDPAKSSPAPMWTYYGAVDDGQGCLVGGRTGMLVEGITNGSGWISWSAYGDSIRNWLWDISRTADLYVTVGDRATVMTSGNGLDWALEWVPSAVTNSIFLGVGGTTNLLIAVGNQGSLIVSPNQFSNIVVTNIVGTNVTVTEETASTLGVIWSAIAPRPTTNDLQGVGTFNNLFVVTGGNGTVLVSTDGTNWVARSTPVSAFLSSVVSYPGGLVTVGKQGTVLTSPDSLSWSLRSVGTTNWIYRVRYLNGRLIAVGQNGTILTSSNGIDWTRQSSGTTSWLNDVAFVGDTFFIVGSQGTVLASTDASSWTNVGTITEKSLFGAADANGQLVTVGIEGIILRSQVVPPSARGLLAVAPAPGLVSSGFTGGSFSPAQQVYTLSNSGGTTLSWSASKTQAWLSLSSSSGSLAPGSSTILTVSINGNANTLSAGTNSDTLSFVNTTDGNGNTIRSATLVVKARPGVLTVSPETGFISSGFTGGLFSPAQQVYTFSNSGGTALSWSANKTQKWLSLSTSNGSLAPGTSTILTVSINANADILSAGTNSDLLSFVNTTDGNGNTSRSATLVVNARPGVLTVFPETGFSSSGFTGGPFSPSQQVYTLSNSGGTALSWNASKTQAWLSLSSNGGSLAPGSNTILTVSMNANANTLSAGTNSDTLGFINTTDGGGNLTRRITVAVSQASFLRVLSSPNAGWFRLQFIGEPGRTGIVQTSIALLDWSPLSTNTTASDGTFEFTDATAGTFNKRLYRVFVVP
jgi:hypothetical protein